MDDRRKCEEFVLLAPWKEVSQHHDFGKSTGFNEYFKIKRLTEEADIKHVRKNFEVLHLKDQAKFLIDTILYEGAPQK